MTKNLIGYKLSGKATAEQIATFLECDSFLSKVNGHELFFLPSHIGAIESARNAGVLDLWFEPVYITYPHYKVGDWVIGWHAEFCEEFQTKAWEIGKIRHSIVNNTQDLTPKNYPDYYITSNEDVRIATPAEIKAAQSIMIGDYEVCFISKTQTTILGVTFDNHFWKAALVIAEHMHGQIIIMIYDDQIIVSQSDINRILNKMTSM
jgi:hypothetical protein